MPIFILIIQMLTVVSTYVKRGLIKYKLKVRLGGFSTQNKRGWKRRMFPQESSVPLKSEEELFPFESSAAAQEAAGLQEEEASKSLDVQRVGSDKANLRVCQDF